MSDRLTIARAVNRSVNGVLVWTADSIVWKEIDYWPTTREMLAGGIKREDCDGHAIYKAGLLWDAHGFDPETVTLAIGWVDHGRSGRVCHMVCLWWDGGGDPWVLDNLEPAVWRLSDRPELKLRVCFNRTQKWALKEAA